MEGSGNISHTDASEPKKPERAPFGGSSIIYKDENAYQEAANSPLKGYLDVLHGNARLGVLGPDYWRRQVVDLSDEMKPGGSLENNQAEMTPYLINISDYVRQEDQKAKQEAQSKKTEEEKPQQKPQTPFTPADVVTASLAGDILAETGEAVFKKGVKEARRFTGRLFRGRRQAETGGQTAQPQPEPKSASGSESTPTGNAGEPPKEPPSNGEGNKENEFPQKNFGEIQNRIISLAEKLYRTDPKDIVHTKDDEELAALVAKREIIYERAEKRGLIGEIREAVINTIKDSNWNNVRGDILSKREGIVKTFNDNSGDDPEFEGLADAAVKTIADSVAIQGYFGARNQDGTWDEAFLGRHGQTVDSLNAREFRTRASAFVVFTDDLADLVGYNERKEQEAQDSGDQAYKNLHQQPEQPGSQDKLAQLLERQISIDEQQLELLRKGYKGFIQVERVRAILNPEQFDQSLPPWYEELSPKEQEVIRARLSMNYWAAVKKKTGMADLQQWNESQGITFERSAFDTMWREMPGFRQVMATMVNDIFDKYKRNPDGSVARENGRPTLQDHLVISGSPYVPAEKDAGGRITTPEQPATKGYAVVQDPARFVEYKKNLAKEIEVYLKPHEDRLLQTYRGVALLDLAQASVAAVDNMLFAGGAYDSGDEKRKITPGSADIYSEQVRAFFMPGIKGKEGKWLKTRKPATGKTDESFGGPLGEWIRDNAQANRKGFEIRTEQNSKIVLIPDKEGFKARLQKNQIGLIPERFFYSLLDHTSFAQEDGYKWEEKSLAVALLQESKARIDGSQHILDYENNGSGININKLGSAELLGSYADTRSDAVRLFNHIVGGDPKGRLDRSTLMTLLSRARGEELLNPIFRNEDLVTAAVIMMASPERGLLKGTTEMVLDLPDYNLYDSIVTTNLSDNRIYEGMPAGFRQRLFNRLNAKDTTKMSNALAETFGIEDSLIGRRNALRREAALNVANEAKRTR